MTPNSVIRILDASLNRCTEGLRVIEDYTRFVLDDPFLTAQIKALRHDVSRAMSAVPPGDRHAGRDTQQDVGTAISTEAEVIRADAWEVCAASCKRAEQSLRSLEEYGKLVNGECAGQYKSFRYRLYTLEKAIDIGRLSRKRLETSTLCVLVGGQSSPGDFEILVESLVQAGVGMIQLRDKSLDDRNLVQRGRMLRQLTRHVATLCIINDRADIAAVVDADGVHLGQEDLSVKDARAIVGTRMLIGISTHNIVQARAAVMDGANYLGAGPTFPSHTKSFDAFAGLAYLQQLAAETSLPTYAIGGVTLSNIRQVLATGIRRVAVSAAIAGAANPSEAAAQILSMLQTTGLAQIE